MQSLRSKVNQQIKHKMAIVGVVCTFACFMPAALYSQTECVISTAESGIFSITDDNLCGSSTDVSNTVTIITQPVCESSGIIDTKETAAIFVDTYWNPASIKKHPLGHLVTLPNLPVSQVFSDRFYIEDIRQPSGIGVMNSAVADVGQKVTVTGMVDVVDGETVLNAPQVVLNGTGPAVVPLKTGLFSFKYGLDTGGVLFNLAGQVDPGGMSGQTALLSDGYSSPLTLLFDTQSLPVPGSFIVIQGVPGWAKIGNEIVPVVRVNNEGVAQ